MYANIGLYSYGAALLSYSILTLLLVFTNRHRSQGRILLLATAMTAIWAAVVAVSTLPIYPQTKLMQVAEVLRNAAWITLLLHFIRLRLQQTDNLFASRYWQLCIGVGAAVILILLFASQYLPQSLQPLPRMRRSMVFSGWLSMAVFGLLLLEQIFRNATPEERWSVKHLCLGIGVVFAYDFFMYAEALLFNKLDPTLWQARGIVIALTAIPLAVAINRLDQSGSTSRSLNVSRHVVFHSVTLLATGFYLIAMSLAGYFIRYRGGSWGGVLQITFLCASGLLLFTLLFSGKIRSSTRVWLSKNFFSYKYDYRVEWLQFSDALAATHYDAPDNIVMAIARLCKSPGGLLWVRTDADQLELACCWEMAQPEAPIDWQNLPQWLNETEWIIDLKEWHRAPDLYDTLELSQITRTIPRAWLVIPLVFGDELQGMVLLRESDLQADLNWEDRDLLKVAGRQAASHLAQYKASQALMASRQFEAFNRLSAYVIHDLKNILAQQSLILSNADKHRHNPEFMDDVILTVRNSVARMTRLMEQMRSGIRGKESVELEVNRLLQEVVAGRSGAEPIPDLHACEGNLQVEADKEQLANVFNHVIQNAQEATPKTGQVTVRVSRDEQQAVVEIEDNGSGMDEDFIRNRLFKPFDSTKGLTGMGIGAFESRELVRSLGGDIEVYSELGTGSRFKIILPALTRA